MACCNYMPEMFFLSKPTWHLLHLLLQLPIEATIKLFVDGNGRGEKTSFKFLPLLYTTLNNFFAKK